VRWSCRFAIHGEMTNAAIPHPTTIQKMALSTRNHTNTKYAQAKTIHAAARTYRYHRSCGSRRALMRCAAATASGHRVKIANTRKPSIRLLILRGARPSACVIVVNRGYHLFEICTAPCADGDTPGAELGSGEGCCQSKRGFVYRLLVSCPASSFKN